MGDHVPREMTVRANGKPSRLTEPGLQISGPGSTTLRVSARGVVAFLSLLRTSKGSLPTHIACCTAVVPLFSHYRQHSVSSSLARALFFGFLAAASTFGCVSTPTPVRLPDPSVPQEPERTPTPPSPATGPLSFTYRDGTYAYDIRQLTTVSIGVGGAVTAEDTLQTSGNLTYTVSSVSGAPVVSAMIDSLVIASVRDTTMPVRRLAAPVTTQLPLTSPVLATLDDSTIFLSTCDSMEEAARVLAADVHLRIPVPVQEGQHWTDSASTTLCRGGLPLTAVRVSQLQIGRIRETRDSVVATVTRRTVLTITGSGMQGARRITVRGQGTSETLFTYDVRAGRFLESTGQSVLELGFETIQQTEQVTQRSTSSVRLRAAVPAGD
jgi:hypothetical protein